MPAERKYCQKWCTDFTYLFLENHEVRYNCTIIDLHDRSVVASITDRHITSDLAIRTLKKALESQPVLKGELILHSDQGSQFTSKAFVEFCESVHVTQSMSKAGCCPRNDQSSRKIKSTRICRAGSYFKPVLVQIANALIKSKKHPEFTTRYRRIKARRGHKKTIIAICRMILTAIWHILTDLKPYTPEGFLIAHHPQALFTS